MCCDHYIFKFKLCLCRDNYTKRAHVPESVAKGTVRISTRTFCGPLSPVAAGVRELATEILCAACDNAVSVRVVSSLAQRPPRRVPST
jgi:hypothetical protein